LKNTKEFPSLPIPVSFKKQSKEMKLSADSPTAVKTEKYF
jgi:hypothetical protein